MISEFRKRINNIIKNYPKVDNLLDEIINGGETLFIGGALREYKDNQLSKLPRDFDIVVDTDDKILEAILLPYNPHKNRFEGYQIDFFDFVIDVWCLKNTWAFKENLVKCQPKDYSSRLQDTVFLNIDAIVYNLSQDIWYDEKYSEAMRTKILDVVLEENPQLALNIVRTIFLKQKYSMHLSERLKEIIYSFVVNSNDFISLLMQAQLSHYKRIIVNEINMKYEISNISSSMRWFKKFYNLIEGSIMDFYFLSGSYYKWRKTISLLIDEKVFV